MEIVSSLIEGGCYSVVFALLLFVALRANAVREKCYRKFISELLGALGALDLMNGKVDRLISICEKRDKSKKKEGKVCDSITSGTSVTEPSSAG